MSEVLQRSHEEVEEIAKSKGLELVLPQNREIALDLDGEATLNSSVLKALAQNEFEIVPGITTASINGNKHMYLTAPRSLSDGERILLQALLGSDPVKEALSWRRHQEECNVAVAMFETKAGLKAVELWRARQADLNQRHVDAMNDLDIAY